MQTVGPVNKWRRTRRGPPLEVRSESIAAGSLWVQRRLQSRFFSLFCLFRNRAAPCGFAQLRLFVIRFLDQLFVTQLPFILLVLWAFFPTGVATANRLPSFHPESPSFTSTNSMSSFTTSINLLLFSSTRPPACRFQPQHPSTHITTFISLYMSKTSRSGLSGFTSKTSNVL